jgi:hypothetical protein
MEQLSQFIKPELLLLIPVLYILGTAIKQSPIKDWLIPYILGGAGILLSLVYVLSKEQPAGLSAVCSAVFTAITQGVLVAGGGVYADNLIKQAKEGKTQAEGKKDE